MPAEVKIIILDDGRLQVFTEGFEAAAQAGEVSEALLQRLRALGLPIEIESAPEQHRPDGPRHVHIIERQQIGR